MKNLKQVFLFASAAVLPFFFACSSKSSSDPTPAPVLEVDFTWNPNDVYVGFPVQITPTIKNVRSYRWDITSPDGSQNETIENQDPNLRFGSEGEWKIKLTGFAETGFKGKSLAKEKTVTVNASKRIKFREFILYPAFNDTLGLDWDNSATLNGQADLDKDQTQADLVAGYFNGQTNTPFTTSDNYKLNQPLIASGSNVKLVFNTSQDLLFSPNSGFFSVFIYDIERGKGANGADIVHRMVSIGTNFFSQTKGNDKKLVRRNSNNEIMYELLFDVVN